MKKGKIIVIEGVDSVGKHTQTLELEKKLVNDGYKVYHHSFPSYEEKQATLAEMYLNGTFGKAVDCLDYKVLSSFFAVDRIATYHLKIKDILEKGYIVILDRYTTSNMVHQASKLNNKKDILDAVNWIDNYEFNDLGLPRPDAVLYLMINQAAREKMLDKRRNDNEKDVTESDKTYLNKCSKTGLMIAKHNKWHIIDCSDKDTVKSIDSISNDIYDVVIKTIRK